MSCPCALLCFELELSTDSQVSVSPWQHSRLRCPIFLGQLRSRRQLELELRKS